MNSPDRRSKPDAGEESNGGNQAPPKPTIPQRRVASSRILLAAVVGAALAGAWWFRHWSETPISESVGSGPLEQVVDTSTRVGNHPAVVSVSNALQLAAQARSAGRRMEASKYYSQILEKDPRQPTALYEQGLLMNDRWSLANAEKCFNTLLEIEPKNHDARRQRAITLAHEEKFTEAESDLAILEQSNPDDPIAMNLRGTIEEFRGSLAEAKERRERFLAAEPTNQVARESFINLFQKLGQADDMPQTIEGLATAAKDSKAANALRVFEAIELDGLNRLGEARSLLEKITGEEPDNREALFTLSRVLIHQQEFQKAELILRGLLARSDSWPAVRLELAHALNHQGRDEEAWREFETAYLAEPDNGAANAFLQFSHSSVQGPLDPAFKRLDNLFRQAENAHPEKLNDIGFHHAAWLRDFGDSDGALTLLNDLLQKTDGPGLRIQRSEILSDQNETKRSLADAEAALELNPGYARAWLDKGQYLETLGQLDEAAECYKNALVISPDYRPPTIRLQRTREKQRQLRRAAEDYDELIKRRPSGRMWYLLRRGYAWAAAGWTDRLFRDADEAFKLAPGNVEIMSARADGLRDLGHYDEASEAGRQILARYPQNVFAHKLLADIALELGELEDAEKHRLAMYDAGDRLDSLMVKGRIQIKEGKFDDAYETFTRAHDYTDSWRYVKEFRAYASNLAANPIGIQDHDWLLERLGMRDYRANYWLADKYLLMRRDGQNEAAGRFLQDALQKSRPCYFPSILLQVFSGHVPQEVAIADSQEIVFETLKKVDLWPHKAYGYEVYMRAALGTYAEVEGDFDSAREHYQWIINHPDRLNMEFVPMAAERLKAINGKASIRKLRSVNEPASETNLGINDGLLAWLPMTDDLQDHGPQHLPVSNHGSVRVENGNARFPGDGNYLQLPHVSLNDREFSISFWMKIEGSEDHYSLLAQKQSDDCDRAMYLQLVRSNELRYGFFKDDVIAPSGLSDRQDWNHVVFQYSRYRQCIWLNGRLLVERLCKPFAAESGDTLIGAMPKEWTGHHEFSGWMRDFRIYGRALAQTEIQRLAGVDHLLADKTKTAVSPAKTIPAELQLTSHTLSTAEAAKLLDPRPFLEIRGNHLKVSGPPVQVYEVQATADLNTDWSPLTLLTNLTGSAEFIDQESLREGTRFYRVEVRSSTPAQSGQ